MIDPKTACSSKNAIGRLNQSRAFTRRHKRCLLIDAKDHGRARPQPGYLAVGARKEGDSEGFRDSAFAPWPHNPCRTPKSSERRWLFVGIFPSPRLPGLQGPSPSCRSSCEAIEGQELGPAANSSVDSMRRAMRLAMRGVRPAWPAAWLDNAPAAPTSGDMGGSCKERLGTARERLLASLHHVKRIVGCCGSTLDGSLCT